MPEKFGPDFEHSLALEEYKSLRSESADAKRNQQSIFQWSVAAAGIIVAGSVAVTRTTNPAPNANANGYLAAGLSFLFVVPVIMACAFGAWIGEVQRMERVGRYLRSRESLAMSKEGVSLHDPGREASFAIQWESLLSDKASLRYYGKNRLGSAAACALFTIFFYASLVAAIAVLVSSPARTKVNGSWTTVIVVIAALAAITFAFTLMAAAFRLARNSSDAISLKAPNSSPSLDCDAVFLCLNEQEAVEWVLGRVPNVASRFLIDDHSTDFSRRLAEAMGVPAVSNSGLRGVGAASNLALQQGVSSVVCVFDCDGTVDPRWISELAKPIIEGRCDLVVAERGASQPGWTYCHRLLSRSRIWLVRRKFHAFPLNDLGSARAIRREVIEAGRLPVDDTNAWSLELALRVMTTRGPDAIGKVEMPYLPRIGRSKVSGTVRGALRTIVDSVHVIRKIPRS